MPSCFYSIAIILIAFLYPEKYRIILISSRQFCFETLYSYFYLRPFNCSIDIKNIILDRLDEIKYRNIDSFNARNLHNISIELGPAWGLQRGSHASGSLFSEIRVL